MRFLFVRIILPLLVFWLVRLALKSIGGSNSHVANAAAKLRRPVPTTVSPGGELMKDPVCGTYVSAETSVTKRINGQIVHFCSPVCRDKYRAA
jgi:uncharacterized protein